MQAGGKIRRNGFAINSWLRNRRYFGIILLQAWPVIGIPEGYGMEHIKEFVNKLSYVHIAEEERGGNRACLALGYFLFFLPLLTNKGTASGKYVANQGLLLFIMGTALSIVFGALSHLWLMGWIFDVIGGFVGLVLFAVELIGFVKTYSDGEMLEIPVIGQITLIK